MNKLKRIFTVATLFGLAGSTTAAAIDVGSKMQCAILEAVSCELRTKCDVGGAEMVNLPDFVLIDIPNRQVTGNRPDGTDLATTIERVESLEGSTIIQGGEFGVGWTILLSEDDGNMTVSGSREGEGMVLFGVCVQ